MTSILVERELTPTRSDHQAIAEVGGLWAVPHWAMSRAELTRRHDEIIEEARRRGVRALDTDVVDVALLERCRTSSSSGPASLRPSC